jgi:Mor family transcriptional regulator
MSKYEQYYSEWIEQYNSGLNTYEIAEKYGCNKETVRVVIQKNGIMRHTIKYTEESYKLWIEDYRGGMNTREIANKYNACKSSVCKIIKKLGYIRSISEAQRYKYVDYYTEWVELYKSGKSIYDIAIEYGCSRDPVSYAINNAGIMRTISESLMIYDKFYDTWIERYKNGESLAEIANSHGCNPTCVGDVVSRAGVIRNHGKTRSLIHKRKYVDTDTYFDKIDNEGAAYYLGLILADGCIHSNKIGQQQASLVQQIGDRYIIDNLANILGRKTHYMKERMINGTHYISSAAIRLTVTSDHLVNVLKGYGFTERKSTDNHEATVFKHIPNELMRHFIRGIIDGDGSIGLRSDCRCGHIQVAGNKQDMQAISDVFSSIGCRSAIPHSHSSIYSIRWSAKSDVTTILHYLYDNSTIYLDRKKVKAANILTLYRDAPQPIDN